MDEDKIKTLEEMDELADEELEIIKRAHEIGTSEMGFTVVEE